MVVTDHGVYQNRFSSTEIHTFLKGPICSIFTRPLTPLSIVSIRKSLLPKILIPFLLVIITGGFFGYNFWKKQQIAEPEISFLVATKEAFLGKFRSDITVDGEIFIVPQSRVNIKMGLVEVGLIPMRTLLPLLEEKHIIFKNELAILEPKLEAAWEKRETARKEQDAAKGKLWTAFEKWETARKEQDAAKGKWETVMGYEKAAKEKLMSGNISLQSCSSSQKTKTNADGHFHLVVPGSETFAIVASSSRKAGEKEEKYHWLLKVDPKEGKNQTITLSNDNLMTPEGIGVFIKANKK